MRPLVVIPARAGSKGLPGKNIRPLNGKPLIHYTIEAAQSLFENNLICISSDSNEIISVAEEKGLKVPFIRPAELSTDIANSQDVLLHALDFYQQIGFNPGVIILLQPTSPFRTSFHINEALKLFNNDLDMVTSVKVTSSNPYFVLREEDHNGYLVPSKHGNFTRRQDCPEVYELNGAIYIINVKSLLANKISEFIKVKKYVMDDYSSVDIDNQLDWYLAELLIKSPQNE